MEFSVLRRWWPIAVVAALLGLAAFAAGHSSIGAQRIPPAAENLPLVPEYPEGVAETAIPIEPRQDAEATQLEIPAWLATGALAVLGVALLAAAGYLVWTLLRGVLRRRTRALPQQRARTAAGTAAEVVAALDAGLVELDDTDTDPRTAVIACWVRLEEAAATVGVPRRAGDTPTDLVTRLLRGDPTAGVPAIVSADVLAGFAEVYREARYAPRAVDERTRDQARVALRRLRGELTATAGSDSSTGDGVPA
ncbi:DUF4129 domain-containing protein [Micromonospora yangpuensis]|uniref:Protein-glutamine gamma-glutamyltransferase-like C-terminal domain-containing protein n=1 Tax=Micromonospora yangpuensis TaxID=683228 RepID=A0A1C6U728_9ACTN|nr:DUF4129 domain-containing protein [Micromonospora yangpuensis]GGL90576.1 hypothetical protein GCM10012279_05440 [Micromonospora yangpuensis]SCL49738.1 protein of unknown function [Micromonospora yangpuensis]